MGILAKRIGCSRQMHSPTDSRPPVQTGKAAWTRPDTNSQNTTGTIFLFGGTARPNIVQGQDFLVAGNITDRISSSTSDNLYLNRAAFATSAANTFGNAPRILPGVMSPVRKRVVGN